MLLHAFFAAASKMLQTSMQNPTSPDALLDLRLVKPFLRLLERLIKDPAASTRSEELHHMHQTCSRLHEKADEAVRLFNIDYTVWSL